MMAWHGAACQGRAGTRGDVDDDLGTAMASRSSSSLAAFDREKNGGWGKIPKCWLI